MTDRLIQQAIAQETMRGTPQGGPLSPLLSNIVLDELDKERIRRSGRNPGPELKGLYPLESQRIKPTNGEIPARGTGELLAAQFFIKL